MFALIVIATATLLATLIAGSVMLATGSRLQSADSSAQGRHAADGAPGRGIAERLDEGLLRTRVAVETLIQPDLDEADMTPPRARHTRAETYRIVGAGLLGLALLLAVGLLLLATG